MAPCGRWRWSNSLQYITTKGATNNYTRSSAIHHRGYKRLQKTALGRGGNVAGGGGGVLVNGGGPDPGLGAGQGYGGGGSHSDDYKKGGSTGCVLLELM